MQSRRQSVKPIQLISFDTDKNLVLSPEAIQLFQTLQAEELHIVTVAGKYRTGKSYILNRVLLNQNSGFEVGPTINACTKGLWMWPKIVEIPVSGKVKKCIIIDTEGLGSLEEGENTDIKIFLMAILLSSYLIYNSVGSIDEKAIQNLSLVINLAELLHKNDNQYDSQELINSFPSFMWLVRDFSLRLQTEKGESMTSQQYLEAALRYQNSASQVHNLITKAAERKNSIRKKLKTFFEDRNCFTLIRPTENERDLQNLSTLPEKKLRPDFVRLINEFKEVIIGSLKPKRVRGKSVTPQGFIELCKYFVTTINSGKLPSINSHWDNLCLKEASRIIEIFSSEHSNKLNSSYQEDDEPEQKLRKVELVHCKLLRQACEKIEKSFLGKLQKELSKERVDKILSKIYENAVKEIQERRYDTVKEIIQQIFSQIIQEFASNKLESFEQIFARFEQIKQKYKHDSRIYQSFYENSKDVFQQFLRNLKDKWSREESILHQKNHYLEKAIQQKTEQTNTKLEEYSNTIQQLESKLYKNELQNSQLTTLINSLKQQVVELRDQNQQLRQTNEQLESLQEQNSQEQLEQMRISMQNKYDEMNNQNHLMDIEIAKLSEMCKQSSIKERKTQREMEIFKNKCSEYLKQNLQLSQKLGKVNKQLMEVEQSNRKSMIKQCNSQAELPQIMSDLHKKIGELEIKCNLKQQENRNLTNLLNCQKVTHETLMRAPQNINYLTLKKNYEMEKQACLNLQSKINDFDLIYSLCSIKCLICSKNLDRLNAKNHVQLCSQTKCVSFDVSYEFNGNGQIQFIIDVNIDDQSWTVRKTVQNIKHFLKKMKISSTLFDHVEIIEEDIGLNEERRVELDDIFNQSRRKLLTNTFLIEYFGVDLNFLNNKNDRLRDRSLRGSKMSIDWNSFMDENIDPCSSSNMLMKTSKFSKKTFNFGNI